VSIKSFDFGIAANQEYVFADFASNFGIDIIVEFVEFDIETLFVLTGRFTAEEFLRYFGYLVVDIEFGSVGQRELRGLSRLVFEATKLLLDASTDEVVFLTVVQVGVFT